MRRDQGEKEEKRKKRGHENLLGVGSRDGSGPGESGYSFKSVPFGPGMDYTYWTVDVYGDTRINPRGDGLTLTPAPYPPCPVPVTR